MSIIQSTILTDAHFFTDLVNSHKIYEHLDIYTPYVTILNDTIQFFSTSTISNLATLTQPSRKEIYYFKFYNFFYIFARIFKRIFFNFEFKLLYCSNNVFFTNTNTKLRFIKT